MHTIWFRQFQESQYIIWEMMMWLRIVFVLNLMGKNMSVIITIYVG